jgi:methylated-DNA-[protein]-cysteine S-methyltransferase
MPTSSRSHLLVLFPSRLGWMAMIGAGDVLCQLTLGHSSPRAAAAACDPQLLASARRAAWNEPLRRRLQSYARGTPVDFTDVPVDLGTPTDFRRRVVRRCREIPYGQVVSYGELAARAGFPGAARAVGNCMAANRLPLVVPCHRVVRADGRPGAYSAPGGTRMKLRLLSLEGVSRHSGLLALSSLRCLNRDCS